MAKLRVISGELKGRYVTVDGGADFRPTQERVRESAAEMAKRKVWGAAVADLCAGSGAFGFEMLSRGAASVDFVESDAELADGILRNARDLGVGGRARVVRGDVRRFVDSSAGGYGVIFYDPPYDDEELRELVPKITGLLKDGGILIYERRRGRHEKKAADTGGKAGIIDARVYSDTVIEIYGRGGNADSALPGDV